MKTGHGPEPEEETRHRALLKLKGELLRLWREEVRQVCT
jgi:hypothetical protein